MTNLITLFKNSENEISHFKINGDQDFIEEVLFVVDFIQYEKSEDALTSGKPLSFDVSGCYGNYYLLLALSSITQYFEFQIDGVTKRIPSTVLPPAKEVFDKYPDYEYKNWGKDDLGVEEIPWQDVILASIIEDYILTNEPIVLEYKGFTCTLTKDPANDWNYTAVVTNQGVVSFEGQGNLTYLETQFPECVDSKLQGKRIYTMSVYY
jgi:hypothetical protein